MNIKKRHSIIPYLFFVFITSSAGKAMHDQDFPTMEQLDSLYKKAWDLPKYHIADAGRKKLYLNEIEKKVIYYLNLLHLDPKLFAATYAKGYKGSNLYANSPAFETNELSLINDLNGLDSLPLLVPTKSMYQYAKCQADAIGEKGIVNNPHDRRQTGCPELSNVANAENIGFGKLTALDIVMGWLNDADNAKGANQLGHRKNCLGPDYNVIGISIHAHKVYDQCAVLDLAKM